MGRQCSPMAVKSAVFVAVRERLITSNLTDAEFAEVLSKELNARVTKNMISYYRTELKLIPYKTRKAHARREALEQAAREREAQRARHEAERETQRETRERAQAERNAQHRERAQPVLNPTDVEEFEDVIRTYMRRGREHMEERLAERCRVFDLASKNLWAKFDEYEKRSTKTEDRVRILEGRITRLEIQARATAGTLPNGWKIVDDAGKEIERVETSPANGAHK